MRCCSDASDVLPVGGKDRADQVVELYRPLIYMVGAGGLEPSTR